MDSQDDENRKRRRIVIDDEEDEEDMGPAGLEESQRVVDEEDENISNPDELLSDEEEEPGDGEDLMGDNWRDDYAAAPELDYYDPAVLAADDDEELFESYEKRIRDRIAAEEELDALDAKRRAREFESDYNLEKVNRYEQMELDEYDEMDEEYQDDGAERPLNLEKFECPLREWIAEERTRREIHRRFKKFLMTYYDDIDRVTEWHRMHEHEDPKPPLPPGLMQRPPTYPFKIRTMCAANASSLVVSYAHIAKVQSLLAIWLTDVPRDMMQIFDEVLQSVVLQEFPHYSKISSELHVRISDLPISDKLRDLRQGDLNNLVRVCGVVTRRTGVFPQMLSVVYDCASCSASVGPFKLAGNEIKPDHCPQCNTRGALRINQHRTVYGNYQRITLQESPGTVPPGRIPRYKDVVLLGDLIDIARPGDEVEVTGIYMHTQAQLSRKSNGFPVFSTIIEANYVQKRSGGSNAQWSEEDKRRILQLGKDPHIGERIIRSIAPSIYGHRHVKTAVALALFGGVAKNSQGGSGSGGVGVHRVRGDINVLLLGDPGVAKSQILKYAEKTAPRAVYTTGKGASAVGLTAGVHRDVVTKEWTLEGGALVLADRGVCLIDEFDKMNEQDRTSIHEAMEQQTISVSKAGIVTSLQARCAVLAAANPIGGRYDPSFSFAENVELTDPILSRFDILCVLQDVVDPVADEKLALFVANSHVRSHPNYSGLAVDGTTLAPLDDPFALTASSSSNNNINNNSMSMAEDGADGQQSSSSGQQQQQQQAQQLIPQDLLRKYIAYARSEIRPILHDVDSEKIALLYADLRAQSAQTGGVPIAVRHIESIVRMAEASARMHLREHVRADDVDIAIKVALESFLQAQKISVRKAMQKNFRKYLTFGEDCNLLLMHQLQGLLLDVEKYKVITKDTSPVSEIYIEALEARARELKIFDLRPFYQSPVFRNHGLQVDLERGIIRKVYTR